MTSHQATGTIIIDIAVNLHEWRANKKFATHGYAHHLSKLRKKLIICASINARLLFAEWRWRERKNEDWPDGNVSWLVFFWPRAERAEPNPVTVTK